MNLGSRGPVVLDTGVFGARLTPSGRLLAVLYRPTLEGRPWSSSPPRWQPGRLVSSPDGVTSLNSRPARQPALARHQARAAPTSTARPGSGMSAARPHPARAA